MKKVLVEFKLNLLWPVDDAMNEDDVNFYFNESSWCCSNLIMALESYQYTHGCICDICEGKYIREATQQDIEKYENY